jgi:Glycerol-3-phosphate O-acyltransferase
VWTTIDVAIAVAALTALLLVLGRRSAKRLHRTRRLHVERFKLKKRHADIKLEVFGSPEVVSAIKAYAKEHHVSIETAYRQARIYLAEILPKFNLLAYYRVGAPLSRLLLHFLYRVVVERKPIRDFNERAPKGAVVVYVINHRSNADYVLVAHMLFKFISLSYAVGEWARVWPLNHLFKWFGAYFIRRRYREPLYHAVLRRFVQTITKNGVTQGIFLEGGLTRDGAFQKPKLGMLDYIVTSKVDPEFEGPLYLIPTALNFDRTLEDRNLTEELMGVEDRSTKWDKLTTTSQFLFKNTFRSMFKRFKRYGFAVVSFGEPLLVDDFIREFPAVVAPAFEQRKPHLEELADRVMMRISDALPVTPVPVVAKIFRDASSAVLSERQIVDAIRQYRDASHERVWLMREREPEDIWEAARSVLELRRLVEKVDGGWQWAPQELLLRDYYANSLVTYVESKSRRSEIGSER